MSRCSNRSVAKTLASSSSMLKSPGNGDVVLERKITMATEDFTSSKFCELILRDRNRLSKDNALTLSDYVIAMKREINPRLSYKKSTIQFLAELSKAVGVTKKFIDMTRDDVLCYLDECRKTETEDPSHKWIGSYNTKLAVLSRFFKWLHYPEIDDSKKEVNYQK